MWRRSQVSSPFWAVVVAGSWQKPTNEPVARLPGGFDAHILQGKFNVPFVVKHSPSCRTLIIFEFRFCFLFFICCWFFHGLFSAAVGCCLIVLTSLTSFSKSYCIKGVSSIFFPLNSEKVLFVL